MQRHPTLAVIIAIGIAACHKNVAPVPELDCDGGSAGWPQWALGSSHTGTTCAQGESVSAILFSDVVDEHAAAEELESRQELLVHYQQPLISGSDVYMEHKGGQYIPCSPPGSGNPGCGPQVWQWQSWSERAYRWDTNHQLIKQWDYPSDWTPPPNGPQLAGWEPVFHAAILQRGAGGELLVPAAQGAIDRVDQRTGARIARVDPFHGTATHAFVTSPISVDRAGNAYYTALVLDSSDPWEQQSTRAATQGFLIRLAADGVTTTALSFTGLIPGAPASTDLCQVGFSGATPHPFPPQDTDGGPTPSPTVPCGAQRPGINSVPAIGSDGAIYLVSRAHRTERDGFLVALNPDLTLRWATSFKHLLNDGCGVLTPMDNTDLGCASTARIGVDPGTNDRPTPRVNDQSTASPIVAPDGSVLYGALTLYNGFRGHLLKFSAAGAFVASYDFGWDITPAVFPHGATYSIVTKDNRYIGGPFSITQLDASLKPEWAFNSFETNSCGRGQDGGVACADNHPGGFEWCVNSVAIDQRGVVYANSEDGNLYAIGPGGELRGRIFLNLALGAAYTPLALDDEGRIYTQNNGSLYVVGAAPGP
jgi:outer membrane protein assembly factor BamB